MISIEHINTNAMYILIKSSQTHVWLHGFSYGNPTNRMWKLLTGELGDFAGLLPRDSPIEILNTLPRDFQIGLTDVALIPGSDAAEFSKSVMQTWIPNFYLRLRAHVERVRESEKFETYQGPAICAFAGKRQFSILYPRAEPKNVPFGQLPDSIPLPPGWPFPRAVCQIWILPSSSGRAAMTHEQRYGPYLALAKAVKSTNG